MQTKTFYPLTAHFRTMLVLLSGLFLLTGCGSDDKKKDEKEEDDKKPAYERVVILKERFDQLETSLDEMERDLEIQKKRIEKTRETAKAVKRSLLKGNLKGYSLDTVSTDPVVLAAIEKRKEKEREEDIEEASEEKSENMVLNTLLMLGFLFLLVAIFWVALRDRNQSPPYDLSQSNYPEPPPTDDTPNQSLADELTPNVDTSGSYGDLGRPRQNHDAPPAGEESGPEEPKQ